MSAELYIVGSLVWFADGTMATQCLARGSRSDCETFAETAEHPTKPGDVIHPERAPRMLVTSERDWSALIENARDIDRKHSNTGTMQ